MMRITAGLRAVEKYVVYRVVLVSILGKQIPPLHCFCSTRRTLSHRRSLGTLTNQKEAEKGARVFVFICLSCVCGWLLTGSGDVRGHTGQVSSAGAGHTLVSAQSKVGECGDVQAVGPQDYTQISVQELLTVEAPADVGGGGPGAAAQVHAASQLLHHGHGLLSKHWHLVWRKDWTRQSVFCQHMRIFITDYMSNSVATWVPFDMPTV